MARRSAPDGGPLGDPAGDRFMEFWNLVFMQFDQAPDGTRTPLPKPSIDTGAGLERILALVQGVDSVWETDLMAPLIDEACSITGKSYRVGDYDDRDSFAMRVLAEHARSGAMLINDGVFPSNEARGYVLRRIIRRAVRYAYLLGTESLVMPRLAEVAIDVMGTAYPDIVKNRDFVVNVMTKEEERFRQTLKHGLGILDGELESGPTELSGSTAFLLHDTYGFPLELTQEIAGERDVTVDLDGFSADMAAQRESGEGGPEGRRRRRRPRRVPRHRRPVRCHRVRGLLERRRREPSPRPVGLRCVTGDDAGSSTSSSTAHRSTPNPAVRSATPAPSRPRRGERWSSTPRSRCPTCVGTEPGSNRERSRRARRRPLRSTPIAGRPSAATTRPPISCTMRLRQVLGEHVKQAGSMVGPDRLRFDFSHYDAVTDEQILEIERLANAETLANSPTRNFETTKDEAEALGAIAFFGDKYGDIVRVLEAGSSIELCGGTHVRATGDIGTVKVVSESSIGSNLRRIEAVTGQASVALLQRDEQLLADAARLVGAPTDDLLAGVQRKLDEIKTLQRRDQVAAGSARAGTCVRAGRHRPRRCRGHTGRRPCGG